MLDVVTKEQDAKSEGVFQTSYIQTKNISTGYGRRHDER